MNITQAKKVGDLSRALECCGDNINRMVLQTPSGEARNKLTDANMLIMFAVQKLAEAAKEET